MTSPFIPTYKDFPAGDEHNLQKQLVNSYTQSAVAINNRTIGTFDTNSVPNGERWFNPGQQRQRDGFRQVFQITDGTLVQTLGFTFSKITRVYGTATDGTNSFPLPYVDVTNVNNQIMITLSATQLTVTKGAGAPPAITEGTVVVEYL